MIAVRGRLPMSLLALTFLGLTGCGESAGPPLNPTHPVRGAVTLNDQPLSKGTIVFFSPDDLTAGQPPASAEIRNGEYQLKSRAGVKEVKITLEEPTGRVDPTGQQVMRQIIPAKYNANTQLEAEVVEGEANEFDFDLSSR